MKKPSILAAGFALAILLAVPSTISAHEATTQQNSSTARQAQLEAERAKKKAELEQTIADRRAEFEKRREDAKTQASAKLEEAKQKACENRSESFKKRMEGIASRSERRMEVFNKIAERVEAFAEEKNVTVANYDELLSDVETKAEALKQAHELVRENAEVFQCNGDNAQTNTAIFKEAIAQEHEAFKEYRDSIKSLIKVVKQAIEADTTEENNESQE